MHKVGGLTTNKNVDNWFHSFSVTSTKFEAFTGSIIVSTEECIDAWACTKKRERCIQLSGFNLDFAQNPP